MTLNGKEAFQNKFLTHLQIKTSVQFIHIMWTVSKAHGVLLRIQNKKHKTVSNLLFEASNILTLNKRQ